MVVCSWCDSPCCRAAVVGLVVFLHVVCVCCAQGSAPSATKLNIYTPRCHVVSRRLVCRRARARVRCVSAQRLSAQPARLLRRSPDYPRSQVRQVRHGGVFLLGWWWRICLALQAGPHITVITVVIIVTTTAVECCHAAQMVARPRLAVDGTGAVSTGARTVPSAVECE